MRGLFFSISVLVYFLYNAIIMMMIRATVLIIRLAGLLKKMKMAEAKVAGF